MINNEIKLYNKDGSTLIGSLTQVVSCEAEEERNGLYEVVLTSPLTEPLFFSLAKENIIVCKPNDMQDLQAFRIYNVGKFMNSMSIVYARHISFDLAGDLVDKVSLVNASCEFALNSIFRQSQYCKHYRGYSDIINAHDYNMELSNCLEAIAGKEGSIIDTYGNGAEILRDNTNIHVLNKRGHDNGVTIEYGKNLTGFEFKEDVDGLVTAIKPWCKVKNEDDTESILRGDLVKADNWELFSHPYILSKDYSDKFNEGETPTKEKLKYYAEQDFLINKLHIPKANYKIEFIPLSKCVGYEDIEDKISICDTVTIKDYRYGIDTKAKVIKYKYDVITQKYISMEIGEPRTTLGDIIGGVGTQGPPGKDGANGKDGEPGKDGSIEDFPHTLPVIPVLTAKVKGFASIDLSWTFEDKIYYTYELYASKTKDFTPNIFDLIHSGQSSSFLFQAKPAETWYFRVCAKNTHGNRTEFSPQVTVTTKKSDDFEEYFSSLGVGNLVANIFSTDYMEAGIIKANWIELKGASVVNGNGVRTLDINSFGDIHFAPRVIEVSFNGISESIKIDENGMSVKNKEGVDMLDFKYGAMYARDPQNGTVLGTYGSSMIGDYNVRGLTMAGTQHSGYLMIGRHLEFDDNNLNTTGKVDPFIRVFYDEYGEWETKVKRGVYIDKPLFVNAPANFQGYSAENLSRINFKGNNRIYHLENNYNHMVFNVDDKLDITNKDNVMMTFFSNNVIYSYADWNFNAKKIVNANIHDSIIHNPKINAAAAGITSPNLVPGEGYDTFEMVATLRKLALKVEDLENRIKILENKPQLLI